MQSTIGEAREAALAFLYSRIDYERLVAAPYGANTFKLDRMQELLARLGNPEAGLPIVHVAGTKGKGSTSAMIASVLSATGRSTGLFTSPHLDRLEERMAVDGRQCTAEELVDLVDRIKPVAAAMDAASSTDQGCPSGPTYFELTTALALLHFAARRVNAAVLEVGMGGRLDSTNVCQPQVAVITTISFDHTKQLGNTLAAIAREKAGIIKPGIPVISGVLPDEPREVIAARARELGSPLIQMGRDFEFTYAPPKAVDECADLGRLDFRSQQPCLQTLLGVRCGLLGRHQAHNAAVALATIGELRRQSWSIPEDAIRAGLAGVRWPARVEVVGRRPTVIIDAAHNTASVSALVDTLAESFRRQRRVLIFATTRDKDVPGMLKLLLSEFDEIVFTRYTNNPRFVPPEELAAIASQMGARTVRVCPDPASAWRLVHSFARPEDLICVTGSFFIAAEMRHEIARRPCTEDSVP